MQGWNSATAQADSAAPSTGLGLEVLAEESGHLGGQAKAPGQATGAAGGEVGAGSGSHYASFYNLRLRSVKSCQG